MNEWESTCDCSINSVASVTKGCTPTWENSPADGGLAMSMMWIRPCDEVIITVLELRGCALMNEGPAENWSGGRGLRVRISKTFTRGSGCGLDCLYRASAPLSEQLRTEVSPQSPANSNNIISANIESLNSAHMSQYGFSCFILAHGCSEVKGPQLPIETSSKE